jgi:hypothetical protein
LDRLDQRGDVDRVVLEVGVLDDDDVAVQVRDRLPDCRALPPILRQADELDAVASLSPVSDGFGRTVGGAVVDDDDLLVQS